MCSPPVRQVQRRPRTAGVGRAGWAGPRGRPSGGRGPGPRPSARRPHPGGVSSRTRCWAAVGQEGASVLSRNELVLLDSLCFSPVRGLQPPPRVGPGRRGAELSFSSSESCVHLPRGSLPPPRPVSLRVSPRSLCVCACLPDPPPSPHPGDPACARAPRVRGCRARPRSSCPGT